MTILILHGIMGYAGVHWEQWLQDELVKKGHKVIMPDLPNPNHPKRTEWLNTVKKLTSDINLEDLVIVGHSLGVATALDFIEELKSPIKALVSVSGFGDDYGAELNGYFMKEREINFKKVLKNVKKSYVIFGDDDPYVPQKSLHLLAENLKVTPTIISKGGHLNTDAEYTTFPLLLEIIETI